MSIKPKDLAKDGLDIAEESFRKSAFLAYPVVTSELRKWGGEVGGTKRDRGGGTRGIEAAGGVCGGGRCGRNG